MRKLPGFIFLFPIESRNTLTSNIIIIDVKDATNLSLHVTHIKAEITNNAQQKKN